LSCTRSGDIDVGLVRESSVLLSDEPIRFPGRLDGARAVRKDEIEIDERGLYIESWLPERRSRRRPLYLIHGELGGSWLWERYLGYFAGRGWESHALNLRAHFWSSTDEVALLTFDSYADDVHAGLSRLGPRPVLVGHGLGAMLALRVAERVSRRDDGPAIGGLVLISPPLPRELREAPEAHRMREVPPVFRRDLVGWSGLPEQIRRLNPDLSIADVLRVQHMMGQESGAARRAVLDGVSVDATAVADIPRLVIGAGLDRLYPETESERVAAWLGAEYQPYGAHSHYGTVIGEESFRQVADAIRSFLEANRL
jgi:pimeloyl-ACP methyl ester carboxylesterase